MTAILLYGVLYVLMAGGAVIAAASVVLLAKGVSSYIVKKGQW
jgi:hypothetical protein